MFAAIFIFALLAGYVASEIPSYIKVCGRKNPNLDQCILNNIDNVKPKICDGIPEMDIPPSNPFLLDTLVISDTTEYKLLVRDNKVTGLCDFTVNSFHIDMNKLHFDVKMSFEQLQINSTFDFEARILVPIAQKGLLFITTGAVAANVGIDMKITTKSEKSYVYLSQIKVALDIKDYDIKNNLNGSEFEQFNQMINNFIGTNKKEIFENLKPALEEIVSKRILLVSNNLFKHYTYDELLPDRT